MGDHPPEPAEFDEARVRGLVLSSNAPAQAEFLARHGELVDRAVRGITDVLAQLSEFRKQLSGDKLTATLELFLHAAANGVLTAVHHLVSGYPISAGNMMRQHTEAIAMSLLCLDSSSGVLERFSEDRRNYPVHQAPTALRNRKRRKALKELLGFDPEAWETILSLAEIHDQLSHASALSLAHNLYLATESGMILGSEYDPGKVEVYEKDLRRYASGAESFAHLLGVIIVVLKPAHGAA